MNIIPFRPKKFTTAISLALLFGGMNVQAATCAATDTTSLLNCINGTDDTISIDSNITLSEESPLIERSVTIEGNNNELNGADTYRVFFIKSGTVIIQNLTIANGKAKGGNGGSHGGGAGAGLGGGLFVYDGTAIIDNVNFANNTAQGGVGGAKTVGIFNGGAGGGLGGYGGAGNNVDYRGGGGLFTTDDAIGLDGAGVNGGAGDTSVGADGTDGGFGGGGGAGYNSGGQGGFGGGGGAGDVGGAGGFGAGGGYGYDTGGAGGFGGGGGGSYGSSNTPGIGGQYGGVGAHEHCGGGGAGIGGAIFAHNGTLSLNDVSFSGNSASAGTNGCGSASAPSSAGTDLFICTTAKCGTASNADVNQCGSTSATPSGGSFGSDCSAFVTNADPVNTLPSSSPSIFEDSADNTIAGISIADGDSDDQTVTMTVTNGTVSLSDPLSVSFTTGDGTDDSSTVFNGTLANINSNLNNLKFTPTADYDGTASIQIQTNDGNGGTDDDTLNINVLNAPDVLSINRTASNPTNSSNITFTVTFSETGLTGRSTEDFTLVSIGSASANLVGIAVASPTSVTLSASSVSGDGTLGLNLLDDDTIINGNSVPLGGVGTSGRGQATFTGQVYTIDNTNPTLSTIDLTTVSDSGSNAGDDLTNDTTPTLEFIAESGVAMSIDWDDGNGFVAAAGAGTGAAQQETLGTAYATDGAKTITVRATDSAGNVTEQNITVTIDATPPSISSFNRKTPAAANTNADSLTFLATFSESVTGVDLADFAVTGPTGAGITVNPVTSSSYDVTITGGDLASLDSTVDLNINSPSITDVAGNALPNTQPGTGETYTVDNADPMLTVEQAGSTTGSTINFTATFNETVSGFTTGDVKLSASTAAGTLADVVTGSGPYNIAVTGMVGHGTVTASVDASEATDSVGNDNAASTSGDNNVQFYATSDLVINEVDYDTPSTDDAEFIELYNKGAGAISLSNYEIRLINGSDGTSVYQTLNPTGSLASGAYYVICGDNTKVANCDLDHATNTNLIQNDTEAVALVVSASGAVVDALTYEGVLPANGDQYTETTQSADDVDDANKGLSRTSDGTDSNDNSSDFAVRCTTPGAANHIDADCTPTIQFSQATAYTAAENVGTSSAITLTRSGFSAGTSGVNVTITGGTATGGGTDYTDIGTFAVNFAATETSKTVNVDISNDILYEPGAVETIVFTVASPTNATLGTQTTATLNISDDDGQPSVTLGLSDSPMTENAGVATVTATLSNASTEDVTVNLTLSGSATGSGTDYNASGSSIVVSAGSTSNTMTLTSVHDTTDEENETITVDITSVTNGTENGIQQVTATITDDDATPSLSIDDVAINENSGTANFTVTLSAISGKTVTVDYATSEGTATAGSDYTAISTTTLTFNPNQTSKAVNVALIGNTTFEDNETFNVDLTNPSNATIADNQGLGTINNDDSAPTVSFTSASQSQTESAASATITAQLSGVSGLDVTVPFTINGSSTATGSGTDYSISATPLTITAGNNSADITVTLNNDSADEPDETVVVDMGTPSNATAGATSSHTVTIQDDDVSLVINELNYDQGVTDNAEFIEIKNLSGGAIDLGAGDYDLKVMASDGSTVLQTIDLTGSVANNDYFVICDTTAKVLNCDQAVNLGDDFLADGPTNAVALVQGSFVVDTVSYEGDTPSGYTETSSAPTDDGMDALLGLSRTTDGADTNNNGSDFGLRCVTPGGANNLSALGPCFQIWINDQTVSEGDSGTVNLGFTVKLPHPATADVTVDYTTIDNTANAGSDYVNKSGTLTFPANTNTDKTVSITINGDELDEGSDEEVQVVLSNPSVNATLGKGIGFGTITDDDSVGFTLSKTTASVNESGTTDTFTMVLDTQPESNVALSVTAVDPTEATVSAMPPLPLTFTPSNWNVAQTVTVTGVDDATSDTDQNTNVIISVVDANSDDKYDPLADQTVTVTTVDNDVPGIALSSTSLSIAEPSGTDSFNIKLNTDPSGDVTVPLTAAGGCSVDTNLVTLGTGNWNTGVNISVTAQDDSIDNNPDRVCTVTTGDPSGTDGDYDGLNAGDVADVIVTITDNDNAGASVTPTSALTAVEGGATANFTVTLATEPASPVTISLNTPSGECSAVAANTLTGSNYNTGVTVTVTATDDNVNDGDQPCVVETSFSGDATYAAIDPSDVTVTAADNDIPGVSISTPSSATEGGTDGGYTVSLDTEPSSGDVHISVTVSSQTPQCTVDTAAVILNTGNMSDTVTVTAIDDTAIEGTHQCVILHTLTNGPAEYPSSIHVANANVTIIDNNPGVVIRHSGNNTAVAEGGGSDTFEIFLSTAATTDVTLTPDAQIDLGSGVGTSHTLNFTAANSPQTITVIAMDDTVIEGNHSGNITLNSSSASGSYDPASFVIEGANITSVTSLNVTITDNDVATTTPTEYVTLTVLSDGPGTVTGGGKHKKYRTVQLNAESDAGATFIGWSGQGCDSSEPQLTLRAEQDLTCTATFEAPPVTLVPGRISFDSTQLQVLENTSTVSLLVQRLDGSDGEISINYSTLDGSAIAGQDYIAKQNSLTWANGDTNEQRIEIQLINDDVVESDESFSVELSQNAGSNDLGNNTRVNIIIANDDVVIPPVVPPASQPDPTPDPVPTPKPSPEPVVLVPLTVDESILQLLPNDQRSLVVKGGNGSIRIASPADTSIVSANYAATARQLQIDALTPGNTQLVLMDALGQRLTVAMQVANTLAVDSHAQTALDNPNSIFDNVILLDGQRQANGHRFDPNDQPEIRIDVLPDARHVGKRAEMILIIEWQFNGVKKQYSRRNQTTWLHWHPDANNFIVDSVIPALPEQFSIDIHRTEIGAIGRFTVFIGYRLDDGSIAYNGIDPLVIVNQDEMPINGLQMLPEKLQLLPGQTGHLSVRGGQGQHYLSSTPDPSIATANYDPQKDQSLLQVTALDVGQTTLTVSDDFTQTTTVNIHVTNALAFNINNGERLPLPDAIFRQRIVSQGQLENSGLSINRQNDVDLSIEIETDPTHQGQMADVILFAIWIDDKGKKRQYMRQQGQSWQAWRTGDSLIYDQHLETLAPVVEIQLYLSVIELLGNFTVYAGYQLQDGTIVHNMVPLQLKVH